MDDLKKPFMKGLKFLEKIEIEIIIKLIIDR